MGGIFEIVDTDGKLTFADRLAGGPRGHVSSWRPGKVASPELLSADRSPTAPAPLPR